MNAKERVKWVYEAKSKAELAERYRAWAKSYDQDMAQDFDYQSPKIVSDYLSKFVARDAQILDAGSGTGLAGELLRARGYAHLTGFDLSEQMLAVAQEKEVYTDLQQGILGEPLDFPTDAFDAVVSAGVFTLGHAPPSGFDELIRVTGAGGHIVFTLHSDLIEEGEFADKLAAMEAASSLSLMEMSELLQPTPAGEPEVTIRVFVYQVLPK